MKKMLLLMLEHKKNSTYYCSRNYSNIFQWNKIINNKTSKIMKELKCPKCGNVFQVDEADYASIVSQVRGKEFENEVKLRTDSIKREMEANQKTAEAEAEILKNKQLDEQKQIINDRESEITRLKSQLDAFENQKQADIKLALATQENSITALKAEIQQEKTNAQLAVIEVENKAKEMIQIQKDKVQELMNQAKLSEQERKIHETALKEQHLRELKMKDEVIDQYKNFKLSLSTKMIGESLEIYCSNQYDLNVRPYMLEAYFGKDTDAKDGTKGDFIFRDIVNGVESVSIMFEMKNEADDTVVKHKNSDFFSKLDKDRKNKKCEYAVLVSMLESDNDLYNNGIYAVPTYEKMFVVRPQQFLTIISLLVQTGRNTVNVKKELEDARNREVDVTMFEAKVARIKELFGVHIKDAEKRYNDAISDIDAAISNLNNMKENLRKWVDHMYKADGNLDDLTCRKLTYKNPTMKEKFDEARAKNQALLEE